MANKLTESKGGNPPVMELETRTQFAQEVKRAWHSAFRALQKSKKFSLLEWGKKHPTEFYKLCQRFIPQDMNISGSVSINVVTGVPDVADFIEGEVIEAGGVGDAHEPDLANGIKADFIDDGSDLA